MRRNRLRRSNFERLWDPLRIVNLNDQADRRGVEEKCAGRCAIRCDEIHDSLNRWESAFYNSLSESRLLAIERQ